MKETGNRGMINLGSFIDFLLLLTAARPAFYSDVQSKVAQNSIFFYSSIKLGSMIIMWALGHFLVSGGKLAH